MNDNYSAHGAKVVEFYQKSKQGLVSLERKWREHFLAKMKPKYLPDLWSVEHNVERYDTFVYAFEYNSESIDFSFQTANTCK